MSSWINVYDGVFFISIATILAGSFGLAVRYCLKSKCEHFGLCWGFFTIKRRVDLEVQEEIAQMEMGQIDNDDIDINIKQKNNDFQNKYIPFTKKNIKKEEKNNLEEKEHNNI